MSLFKRNNKKVKKGAENTDERKSNISAKHINRAIKDKPISPIAKGEIGEKYAVKYLKKQGYKIIQRNMRNCFSEIDIIAENREYIVFVEVKSRSVGQMLNPAFAVTREKQQKIIKAAYGYLRMHKTTKQPRFDIAEVYLNKASLEPESINYIENAFIQGGIYAPF